jgi:hypothetical protein
VAIVINEFEIVAEPPVPPKERNVEPKAIDDRNPQALSTHDVMAVVRHERERHARYWAH